MAVWAGGCAQPIETATFDPPQKISWANQGFWLKIATILDLPDDRDESIDEAHQLAMEHGCDGAILVTDKPFSAEQTTRIRASQTNEKRDVSLLAAYRWPLDDGSLTIVFPPNATWSETLRALDDRRKKSDTTGIADIGAAVKQVQPEPIAIIEWPTSQKLRAAWIEEFTRDTWGGFSFGSLASAAGERDPVDEPSESMGGPWDQLALAGVPTWGVALANRVDGAEHFGATWFYAPRPTVGGLAETIRAGCSFSNRNAIDRATATIHVDAAGLDRSAVTGESLHYTMEHPVTAHIRIESRTPTDFRTVEQVELIALTPNGAKVLAARSPETVGAALTERVTLPAGDFLLRARGSRRSGSGELLEFHTNAIRIHGAPSVRTPLPLTAIGMPLIWMFIAVICLAVPLGWREMFLSLRAAQTRNHMTQTRQRVVIAWPQRPHYWWAAGGLLAFAIYATLFPFAFHSHTLAEGFRVFKQTAWTPFSIENRADTIASAILLAPIGYCLLAALTLDRLSPLLRMSMTILVIALMSGLAFALEFTQVWVRHRTVTLNDIIGQAIGGAMGAMAWLVLGRSITSWCRVLHSGHGMKRRITWLLELYALVFVLVVLYPFDFTLIPSDLSLKQAAGRFITSAGPKDAMHAAITACLFAPVGALIAIWRTQRPGRPRSMKRVALVGLAVSLVTVMGQSLVFQRTVWLADILVGTIGILVGSSIARHFASRERDQREGPQQARQLGAAPVILLSLFYGVGLYVATNAPFARVGDSAEVEARRQAFATFQHHGGLASNGKEGGVREIEEAELVWMSAAKFGLFFLLGSGLGYGVALMSKPTTKTVGWLFAVMIPVLAGAIEFSQVIFAADFPKLLDVALYTCGGWSGMRFAVAIVTQDKAAHPTRFEVTPHAPELEYVEGKTLRS